MSNVWWNEGIRNNIKSKWTPKMACDALLNDLKRFSTPPIEVVPSQEDCRKIKFVPSGERSSWASSPASWDVDD